MISVWPFLLEDPPPGGEDLVRQALAANTFDWEKIRPYVEADPDHGVIVRWTPIASGAQASFNQYGNEVLLDQWSWATNLDMTKYAFTHECAHLIDYAFLNNQKRRDLQALMLADPSHAGSTHPQPELWRPGYEVGYWDRIFEAWADVWVATYAPTLIYPLYPNGSRYSHRCNDAVAVKAIMDRSDTVAVQTMSGATAYDTARLMSMNRYGQTPTVVKAVVAARDTPDAITAATLGAQVGYTFLLTSNGGIHAPAETLAELQRLKPTDLIFVGGTTPFPQSARDEMIVAAQP